ncbi:splicing factor U2AF 35 kDa subunit-like [Teleopsis dalmanni]|uniref:splicing factor U2AF 35 kDa subunit-like n=1 Tax=Teleopsis dalmanni TaxID=139649 RepID=UPI0018CED52A|nr:splicing factor U2AF 35 kDa subunit-like [Teleopsis dalmanni]
MAEYLASIFGTEKDKVNCSFYYKIGACRHGDRCSRIHTKPSFSQTVLLQNMYINRQNSSKSANYEYLGYVLTEQEIQEHYDNFYEDVYVECMERYGEIAELHVCDNLGDHLVGNVYIKFKYEEDATKACEELNHRWFGGRPIYASLSPVTDFREACCRQYDSGECTRSGFCNFLHLKPISRGLRRYLDKCSIKFSRLRRSERAKLQGRSISSSRSRSVSPKRSRSKNRGRSRNRSSSRNRMRSRSRPRNRSRSRRRSRNRSRSRSVNRKQLRRRSGTRSYSRSPIRASPPSPISSETHTPTRSRSHSPAKRSPPQPRICGPRTPPNEPEPTYTCSNNQDHKYGSSPGGNNSFMSNNSFF